MHQDPHHSTRHQRLSVQSLFRKQLWMTTVVIVILCMAGLSTLFYISMKTATSPRIQNTEIDGRKIAIVDAIPPPEVTEIIHEHKSISTFLRAHELSAIKTAAEVPQSEERVDPKTKDLQRRINMKVVSDEISQGKVLMENEASRAKPTEQPEVIRWTLQHQPQKQIWIQPLERRRKIIDGFLFNNELDLLELRFEVLYDVVDYFVLIESNNTFQNTRKPLVFAENKQRFARFADKIIHYAYLFPSPRVKENIWAIEYEHRNAVGQYGVRQVLEQERNVTLDGDDLVFSMDIDEIPDPVLVNWLAWNSGNFKVLKIALSWRLYSFSWLNPNSWGPPVAATVEILRNRCHDHMGKPYACEKIRNARCDSDHQTWIIGNLNNNQPPTGGWHCSWCFPISLFIDKLESFTHHYYNTEQNRKYKYLRECKLKGKWFDDKPGEINPITMIGPGFPDYAPQGFEKLWGKGDKWLYFTAVNVTGDSEEEMQRRVALTEPEIKEENIEDEKSSPSNEDTEEV